MTVTPRPAMAERIGCGGHMTLLSLGDHKAPMASLHILLSVCLGVSMSCCRPINTQNGRWRPRGCVSQWKQDTGNKGQSDGDVHTFILSVCHARCSPEPCAGHCALCSTVCSLHVVLPAPRWNYLYLSSTVVSAVVQ